VIARQMLRENLLLVVGYFALLAMTTSLGIWFWPDLRTAIGEWTDVAAFLPIEGLREVVLRIQEEGYWAYFSVQQFFRGGGVFGVAAAGLLGSGIIAREADNRTAEFLLSRPISRRRIVLVRWGCGALALATPLVLCTGVGAMCSPLVGEKISLLAAAQGAAHTALFVVAVFTTTVWLSARSSHAMRAGIIVLGVLLLQFALYLIKVLWHYSAYNLIDLDVMTPLAQGLYPWKETVALILWIGAFLALAIRDFRKRDF